MVQDEVFETILTKIQYQVYHLLFVLENTDDSIDNTDSLHVPFENHLQLQVETLNKYFKFLNC